jgi:hypothetical protein
MLQNLKTQGHIIASRRHTRHMLNVANISDILLSLRGIERVVPLSTRADGLTEGAVSGTQIDNIALNKVLEN